jgi:alanyl-tRNA synthetase
MMTERIYYDHPQQRTFDATVTAVETTDGRFAVRLDRTCFYPTSGGQPFDTGTLGGFRVVGVLDDDTGSITHTIDISGDRTISVGQRLEGVIDWPRRLDHMQQHSGQHLLSAAFDRLHGARTVGFHLGTDVSTVDLTATLTEAAITAAEDEANRIVWEDRPVTIRYASAADAANFGLRKESDRTGTLRLIDIEGFDLSACGGTHVARTGTIGLAAIIGWERFKGGTRVEFVCGGRALARFRFLRSTAAAAALRLSVGPLEVPAAVERLQAELRDQRRSETALRGELSLFQAARLAESAEDVGGIRVVLGALNEDAEGLARLASQIASRDRHFVVLLSRSRPALVAVARADDVDRSARDLLAALVSAFGGRGGGKPDMARGGGLDAEASDILALVRDWLNRPIA